MDKQELEKLVSEFTARTISRWDRRVLVAHGLVHIPLVTVGKRVVAQHKLTSAGEEMLRTPELDGIDWVGACIDAEEQAV